MDINDIPRDIEALKDLSRPDRYKLFLLLQDDDKDEERREREDREFLCKSPEGQAEALLELLKEHDQNDEGYCVMSAALPPRSKDSRKNEKRMAAFAENVETILNDMRTTHEQVRMVTFEAHGILVVGFQPPKRELSPLPFPFSGMIPFGVMGVGGPPSQGAKPAASHLAESDRQQFFAMCNQAFTIVTLTDDEDVLNKNLDEFVDNAMSGISAETTKRYIQEINRLRDEHAITHSSEEHGSCKLDKMFDKLQLRLEQRAHLSTN